MYTDEMQLVACVNDNWAIGKNGQLLYDIQADKEHFRTVTMGHIIIMGRKTYDSLPVKMLPGREIWMLTRSYLLPPGFPTVYSAIHGVDATIETMPEPRPCVVGGEKTYGAFLALCNIAHITHVKDDAAGDAHCPRLDLDPKWALTSFSPWITEKDRTGKPYTLRYETYERLPFIMLADHEIARKTCTR